MRPCSRPIAFVLAATLLAAGLGACTSDGGSTEEFCAEVEQVPALEAVLARFSESDPDVLADRIAKARQAYADLAEAAPEEIAAETDEVVALVDDVLDAVEEHPTDPAKASAQLRKAMAAHQGVAEDQRAVVRFAQDRCGVRLDATLGEGATSTSTSTTSVESPITTTTG